MKQRDFRGMWIIYLFFAATILLGIFGRHTGGY